jgi:hypothetical protein
MTNASRADVIRCHYFNSVTATRLRTIRLWFMPTADHTCLGLSQQANRVCLAFTWRRPTALSLLCWLYQRLFKYEAWVESCLQCILLTEAVAK